MMNIGDIGNTLKDAATKIKDLVVEHKVAVLVVGGLFLAIVVLGTAARGCNSADSASGSLEETVPATTEVSLGDSESSEPQASEEAPGASETASDTEEVDMVIVELPGDQEPLYEAVTANPESAD